MYSLTLGRSVRRRDLVLKAAGAQTASTSSPAVELGDSPAMNLALVVTAASGTTPTLNVTIEGSDDGTTWYTLGTFAQATAAGTERKAFVAARHVRSRSVVGGTTPSFTYSVAGTFVR